jgi:2-(1,2-epoxy-1,2-dihydrophenyl)acetyl-CoA isomerase
LDYTQIEASRRDEILLLTLHRPERLNAWTPRMAAELTFALEQAEADAALGAIVVTGAGRGFCAGADIAGFDAQLAGDKQAVVPQGQRDWVQLVRSTKPIVAAVQGVAIGVGLTMILPFDRIVASTEARFSLRFVKMGLVPELASSHFLPQRVGFGAAHDLMLSGRMVGAAEALALGLVDEVVDGAGLLDAAFARARSYAENPAPQLRWIKQLLSANASETDLTKVQERELALLVKAYASSEHQEAVAAFLEKRPPRFR